MKNEARNNEIAEILKTIIINILNIDMDSREINENTNLYELGIDSMTIIDLVLEVENEFRISFDEDMLSEATFERFDNLLNLIISTKECVGVN